MELKLMASALLALPGRPACPPTSATGPTRTTIPPSTCGASSITAAMSSSKATPRRARSTRSVFPQRLPEPQPPSLLRRRRKNLHPLTRQQAALLKDLQHPARATLPHQLKQYLLQSRQRPLLRQTPLRQTPPRQRVQKNKPRYRGRWKSFIISVRVTRWK